MQLKSIGFSDNRSELKIVLKPKTPGLERPSPKLTSQREEWKGNLIATKDIGDLKYPFDYLNPPQSEFYVNRFLDANFIISAATSSGKTVIAELARNGKFLYLSPLKAISQEKRDDWTSESHSWSKLKVAISTGDYQLTAGRVQEMRDADVIVMTSEMLDSRSRNMQSERNDWLLNIDTLVIDEFHLLGYEGRGDKLESAVVRFTIQNPKCRLICLSATMPNVQQLSEWLTKLNGKQTVILESTYRPVKLNRHYEQYLQSRNYMETEALKVESAIKIVLQHPEDKFIVFVHTKNTGQKALFELKERGIKAEFHNADLDKEERIRIQSEFNKKTPGSLRTIVATSTLAWGVNTPADSVVIVGLHRGAFNLINNQDIHQMCGRAGRVGKTAQPVGNAYVLIPHLDTEKFIKWCEKIEPINSRMNLNSESGLETLCFHILAEILGEFVTDAQTLLNWYERTLASFQGLPLTLDDAQAILDKLEQLKMIRKSEIGNYKITGLGKVSAYLYYSPFDVYCWYRNFREVQNLSNGSLKDPIVLSWALGNIDSYNIGYIPSPAAMWANNWMSIADRQGLRADSQAHMCATYYQLLGGVEEFPVGLVQFKRQIQADFGRILQALKMMDKIYARFGFEELWDRLEWQIKYGVKVELIDLVKLPKIGAVRAKKLYDAGIRTRKDFFEKSSIAKGVITDALYKSIIEAIN